MRRFWPFLLAMACNKAGPVESLRDEIGEGKTPGPNAPACTGRDEKCLDAIARAYGSQSGFNLKDADQGTAAAVAVVLMREKRGDWVTGHERWTAAMATARGVGADALRLATATRMAELAPRVGKRVEDPREASELVRAMASAMPGACEVYALVDEPNLPPEKQIDHAPCVNKDLLRKEGPGASYGNGVWRALAGLVAMWKDEARAMRTGLAVMGGKPKEILEAKLVVLDDAARKHAAPASAVPGNQWAKDHDHRAQVKAPLAPPDAGAD